MEGLYLLKNSCGVCHGLDRTPPIMPHLHPVPPRGTDADVNHTRSQQSKAGAVRKRSGDQTAIACGCGKGCSREACPLRHVPNDIGSNRPHQFNCLLVPIQPLQQFLFLLGAQLGFCFSQSCSTLLNRILEPLLTKCLCQTN